MKILLNAEPFGFGPSASLVNIFNIVKELHPRAQIDYIGSSHTLDLHSKLGYTNVLEYSTPEFFKKLVSSYDYFITALDFELAELAHSTKSAKVILFDTLAWFWKNRTPMGICDTYIAQDFFGVSQAVKPWAEQTTVYVVPPVLHPVPQAVHATQVLVNLGGIQNPHWDTGTTRRYVELVLNAIALAMPGANLKIACSQAHIDVVKGLNARTIEYSQMPLEMAQSSLIFSTGGLGNLFELSAHHSPCIMLPPANDSQGQQIHILQQNDLLDTCLDWAQVGSPVDYFQKQSLCMAEISHRVSNTTISAMSKQITACLATNSFNPNLPGLVNRFGQNGKEELARVLVSELTLRPLKPT